MTADDFGVCEEINRGILRLHDAGIVGRTSLIVGTPLLDVSVSDLLARPRLEVAIHLNLTDGAPTMRPETVRSLVNARGEFTGGRHYRAVWNLSVARFRAAEVHAEWRAQILRARTAGLGIAYLTSHGHLHLHPALHSVVISLLEEFEIPSVRLVRRAASAKGAALAWCSRLLIARLARTRVQVSYPGRVLGIGREGRIDAWALARELARLDPSTTGWAELIVHPSLGGNAYHRAWGYHGQDELTNLLQPDVAAMIRAAQAA